jgi:parallel beta-helix repeat protein
MRRVRAFAIVGILASMALAAPVFVGAAGGTLVVDDDGAQCKKADFTTIQAAVSAAQPGQKIQVCAGTYTEQVTITTNGLSLESKGNQDAIIKAPAVMADVKAIVRVSGAQDVSIKGFTITGPGGSGCDSLRYGVKLDGGASATIEKNHITQIHDNPFSGCQNGNAIQVGRQSDGFGPGSAKIKNNEIDNYQKSGIVVDGAGSYADIDNNDITGVGPTAIIAQNGIQISRTATADVRKNQVTDNQYSPMTVASAGILLFDAGAGVELKDNTLLRNDESAYLVNADGVNVHHNKSSDNTFDGFGLDETDNATISHNESNDNGGDGIWVGSDSTGNTIEHNKMKNNADHDAHDDAAPGANNWDKNKCATENQPGLCD